MTTDYFKQLKGLIYEDITKAVIEVNNNKNKLEREELSDLYYLIGYHFSVEQAYNESFRFLKEAEKYSINNEQVSNVFINYAENYIDLDDYEKAESFLFKSLRKTEDNLKKGDIYRNLGLVYLFLEDWNKSIKYFSKSLDYYLNIEHVNRYKLESNKFHLATLYLRKINEINKGIEIFEELINDDNVNCSIKQDSLVEIGHHYYENQDYENALVYYGKSLNYLDEDFNSSVYFYMGDSHRVLKDYPNAIKFYEKYLIYNPEDKETLERLERLKEKK